MTKKYLILADSFLYFRDGCRLVPDKEDATLYTLDEAIKIKAEFSEDLDIEFVPIVNSSQPFEVCIQPIEPDRTDFDLYAKYTAKQWTQTVSYYRHFIEAPENQEKLQQAITRLTAYLEEQKQNPNYKFHVVTYVGFPLSLNVENFAPYFCLEVNYGSGSVVTNFLVK